MDYRLFFGEVSPAVYEGSSGPRRRGVGARPRLGSQGIAGHGRLRNSTRPLARTPPQPSKLYRHADQELAERHLALKAKEVFLKKLRPKQPRSSDLELGTTPVVPQIRKWLRGVDLNHRPLGYEPNELPDCSTPHFDHSNRAGCRQTRPIRFFLWKKTVASYLR